MASSSRSTKEKRKGSTHHSKSSSSRKATEGDVPSSSSTRNGGHAVASQNQGVTFNQEQQAPPQGQHQHQGNQMDGRQLYPIQRPWQQERDVPESSQRSHLFTSPMDQWQTQPAFDEPWNNVYGVFAGSTPLDSDAPVQTGSWSDMAWSMDVCPDQHGR